MLLLLLWIPVSPRMLLTPLPDASSTFVYTYTRGDEVLRYALAVYRYAITMPLYTYTCGWKRRQQQQTLPCTLYPLIRRVYSRTLSLLLFQLFRERGVSGVSRKQVYTSRLDAPPPSLMHSRVHFITPRVLRDIRLKRGRYSLSRLWLPADPATRDVTRCYVSREAGLLNFPRGRGY